MISLVTFDLDDTLWSMPPVLRRAEQEMRTWLAARVPGFARMPPAEVQAVWDAVMAAQPGIVHDITLLRRAVLRETLARCGCADAAAEALAAQAMRVFLDWRHRVDFFPAALGVLERLAGRYTLGALTNGNASFRRLGLDRFFAFGYSAADVGACKPHPAMFERALAHAGVPPSEAVHVGDHPVDDIEGAGAAGMATIWLNPAGRAGRTGREGKAGQGGCATATIGGLNELPAAIAALDEQERTPR